MSWMDDMFDGPDYLWDDPYSRPKRRGKPSKRTVKYVGPGHTRVGYAHRTLDIRFKESEKEYLARKRLRRKHGAIKGARGRVSRPRDNGIYVEMRNGRMVYVDSRGREVTDRALGYAERGTKAIVKRDLKNDKYNIEDMRALLRDARWEEVSGNKRWSYDSKETVKQFKKYQKSARSMR